MLDTFFGPNASTESFVILARSDRSWRELLRWNVPALASQAARARRLSTVTFEGIESVDDRSIEQTLEQVLIEQSAWSGQIVAHGPAGDPTSLWIDARALDADAAGTTDPTLLALRCRRIASERVATIAHDEFWEEALAAGGLGVFSLRHEQGTVWLDGTASTHLGLPQRTTEMALDDWMELFVAADRPALYSGCIGDGPAEETAKLTVRVAAPDARRVRQLELGVRRSVAGARTIGVSRDVTAERSQEEIRRKHLAAERANRAKSEFMAQVSHELRTPLNAILGFSQLMEMDREVPLPPSQRERLEVIQHSGRRLLVLIDQLLEIGRIEQGKRKLRPRAVNAVDVASRCADALRIAAGEKGISLDDGRDKGRELVVRADPDALEQVITNLLSNAIKYNRQGGRVRLQFVEAGEGRIFVDDTGVGMSSGQVEHLFEPFNRLGAEKKAVPGTGLGLVITKQLIEAMGGKLLVWSRPRTGSRFEIHLPLGSKRRLRTPSDSSSPDLPFDWVSDVPNRVLYVEDDEVNQVLMDQLISAQAGLQLHTVGTGAEGIAFARRQHPALILLDINLPDMNGREVLRTLRADPLTRDIPCVAVSADALPAHIENALAAGFDDYWTKPLNLRAALLRLQRLLNG